MMEIIGRLGFKGIGFVEIVATPGMTQKQALRMTRSLLDMIEEDGKIPGARCVQIKEDAALKEQE